MHEQARLEKRTILCVEPDPETTELYTALLGHDYQLTFATTALDAVRHANRMAFDAYIVEHWLPDWSGPAFCRELRAGDPHVPVIFCTASAHDRDRATRAGASAYLTKPVDRHVLLSKVRALLALSSAESARARVIAERAVYAELERRLSACKAGHATALGGAQRAARGKARDAFIEGGGTCALFDRLWPEMLSAGQAATGFAAADAAGRSLVPDSDFARLAGSNPAASPDDERRGEA